MDESAMSAESLGQTRSSPTQVDAADVREHERDRRREKPQLSCNFCRRRKVRCDRQHPCRTCVSKGLALSCAYAPEPQQRGAGSVHERIQQLESLVVSLIQQQQQPPPQTPAPPPGATVAGSPSQSFGGIRGDSPPNLASTGTTPVAPAPGDDAGSATPQRIQVVPSSLSIGGATSPAPSEHGSMRMHSHGATYVGSVHWAAVLDSISELKDHYEREEEEKMTVNDDYVQRVGLGPRLLNEPIQATKAEIIASIPTRPVVDRMVSRYFDAQGNAPAVLHSGQFLREYESFWENPDATPIMWVGLLFSIMCLATQYQQSSQAPAVGTPSISAAESDAQMRIHIFRERTVHCLVLDQFTRGGTHVLETLINHCTTEILLCKDADIGLWVLLGILVQLSLSMGYHRDPHNFPTISPFIGEMRRRVWATIVQLDLRVSSQMGMPRLIKPQQCDTAEPRNLLDSDFDESTAELPPSRPETEITPVLYGLAKNRIDGISGLISDLIADTRPYPYSEIMELDRKLQDAQASLPPILRWQPLSQSVTVQPRVVLYRMLLQLAVQRLVICLHRKYLDPSHTQERYDYSRNACLEAAVKILEYQQLVDEETQPDGQLYPVRWMLSSMTQYNFLLGMSVLCYYIQLAKATPGVSLNKEAETRIKGLLRNSYNIWLRSSTVSNEARKAAEHLSLLLGLQGQQGATLSQEAQTAFVTPQDSISLDQVAWGAYQDCVSNFNVRFGMDLMTMDAPGAGTSTAYSAIPNQQQMSTSNTDIERWMTG